MREAAKKKREYTPDDLHVEWETKENGDAFVTVHGTDTFVIKNTGTKETPIYSSEAMPGERVAFRQALLDACAGSVRAAVQKEWLKRNPTKKYAEIALKQENTALREAQEKLLAKLKEQGLDPADFGFDEFAA